MALLKPRASLSVSRPASPSEERGSRPGGGEAEASSKQQGPKWHERKKRARGSLAPK